MNIERLETGGPFAQVVTEMERLLETAGSSRAGLLSVNVYLADIADFQAIATRA